MVGLLVLSTILEELHGAVVRTGAENEIWKQKVEHRFPLLNEYQGGQHSTLKKSEQDTLNVIPSTAVYYKTLFRPVCCLF